MSKIQDSGQDSIKHGSLLTSREVKLNLQINLQRSLNENYERKGEIGLSSNIAKITVAYSDSEIIIAIGSNISMHVFILADYLRKSDRKKWAYLGKVEDGKLKDKLLEAYSISGAYLAFDAKKSEIIIHDKSMDFGSIPKKLQSEIQEYLNSPALAKLRSPAVPQNLEPDNSLDTQAFLHNVNSKENSKGT